MQAGLRNSGLNVSEHGRITVAIRAAPSGLDVPIAARQQGNEAVLALLVDKPYLGLLLRTANVHMQQNEARIQRLTAEISETLLKSSMPKTDEETWEPADVRRERKRREGLEERRKRNEEKTRQQQLASAP
jgi:tRNA wybutosine-synthesizing protein 3